MTNSKLNKSISSASPVHLMLLADNSGSMRQLTASTFTAAQVASQAIRAWVGALQSKSKYSKPWFRFSLIVFEKDVDVWCKNVDVNTLNTDALALEGVQGARTNLTAALDTARQILEETPPAATDCAPYVFLYSDGQADDPDGAVASAKALKELQLPCGSPTIVALGFGNADDEFMSTVATTRAASHDPNIVFPFYVKLAKPDDLLGLLPSLGTPAGNMDTYEDAMHKVARKTYDATQAGGRQ
jgi:uncharacterized protein YegL